MVFLGLGPSSRVVANAASFGRPPLMTLGRQASGVSSRAVPPGYRSADRLASVWRRSLRRIKAGDGSGTIAVEGANTVLEVPAGTQVVVGYQKLRSGPSKSRRLVVHEGPSDRRLAANAPPGTAPSPLHTAATRRLSLSWKSLSSDQEDIWQMLRTWSS